MIPEGLKRPQLREFILVNRKWDLFNSCRKHTVSSPEFSNLV